VYCIVGKRKKEKDYFRGKIKNKIIFLCGSLCSQWKVKNMIINLAAKSLPKKKKNLAAKI
jgi:hypothetical protein